MTDAIRVRFDILHGYAEKHGLDYNELCRTVQDAIAEGSIALQAELVRMARLVEGMKQECGMDPESPTAVSNGKLASIGLILRGLAAAQLAGDLRSALQAIEEK